MPIRIKEYGGCVKDRKPFEGNNCFAELRSDKYVVYSHTREYPILLFYDDKWYGNKTRRSVTTSKHTIACCKLLTHELIEWVEKDELIKKIREYGI
jgi:hypothetical protein